MGSSCNSCVRASMKSSSFASFQLYLALVILLIVSLGSPSVNVRAWWSDNRARSGFTLWFWVHPVWMLFHLQTLSLLLCPVENWIHSWCEHPFHCIGWSFVLPASLPPLMFLLGWTLLLLCCPIGCGVSSSPHDDCRDSWVEVDAGKSVSCVIGFLWLT